MKHLLPLLFICIFTKTNAQCLFPTNLALQGTIAANPFPNIHHNLTALRDSSPAKPYLYVAAMEQGLVIHNITNINAPVQATSIPTSSLGNLYVMSVSQQGSYLFLALGDHFNSGAQNSGMAIIDVSAPASPTVKSVYQYTATSGSGFVAVDGNYAYLAAMQNGIIVLNVTNKTSPTFVSRYVPNINFPKPNPTPSEIAKINARSMVVKNNIMYLCYDAGGVRIINCTVKTALVQTGKYSNPVLLNKPRASNMCVLDDSLLYVTADYAGMEVLKVKDTANVSLVGWWNPWAAGGPNNTWFNSPGHTNEIVYDKNCRMVFMSAGKSDLMAVSVANPLAPDSCSQFGTKVDSNGTWGVGKYGNQLYLAYIVTPVPFYSTWSGVKIVTYNNNCMLGIEEEKNNSGITLFPNPASGFIELKGNKKLPTEVSFIDLQGRVFSEKVDFSNGNSRVSVADLSAGIYFIEIDSEDGILRKKIVVLH